MNGSFAWLASWAATWGFQEKALEKIDEEIGDKLGETAEHFFRAPLFKVADTEVTPTTFIVFGVIVALSILLSRLLQGTIARFFKIRGIHDPGTLGVTRRLMHYTVMIVGISIGLQTAGVQLSALFAAGAVFAVAIGFAMQTVVENFVSGVILLVERTIKPGDVLEVEGQRVKVIRMGIRATLVRSREEEEVIVPNSVLAGSTVKNYTLRDSSFRLRVPVGVTYDSDMRQVRQVLEECLVPLDWRLAEPHPEVLMTGFGDNSVNWEVSVWIDDPWRFLARRSQLHEAVWFALKDAGIVIAFPQLDVHLDADLTRAFIEGGRGEAPKALLEPAQEGHG